MNKKSRNQENLHKIKVQTIKKGYKQTEIGVIPEDWEVKNLDTISTISSSKRIFEEDYVNEGIPFYRGKEVSLLLENKKIEKEYFISKEKYNSLANKYGYPKKDDILVTAVGTLGNIYHIKTTYPFYFKDGNLIWINNIQTNSFLLSKLMSFQKEQIIDNAIGSSQKALTISSLSKTKIPLPPTLEEQKAIAQVLSDTDQLIQNLKTLIAKKKAIKQGAMQELLTGKKRLQGFTEEWETKKLGSLGKTISGLSGKTKTDFGNGNAQYITFMNVMSNVVIDTSILEKVNIKQGETQNTFRKGDLFFNTSSETPEEVGMCAVLLDDIQDVYLNSFCFGYRLNNEELNGLYLSYLINSNIGRSIFESLAQGATRYNLSKTNFNNVTLNVPKDIQEQQAIAQILSDMDAEIEALAQQLQKTQTLKQGMMQELLTGKTRLVKPATQEEPKPLAMVAEPQKKYN